MFSRSVARFGVKNMLKETKACSAEVLRGSAIKKTRQKKVTGLYATLGRRVRSPVFLGAPARGKGTGGAPNLSLKTRVAGSWFQPDMKYLPQAPGGTVKIRMSAMTTLDPIIAVARKRSVLLTIIAVSMENCGKPNSGRRFRNEIGEERAHMPAKAW